MSEELRHGIELDGKDTEIAELKETISVLHNALMDEKAKTISTANAELKAEVERLRKGMYSSNPDESLVTMTEYLKLQAQLDEAVGLLKYWDEDDRWAICFNDCNGFCGCDGCKQFDKIQAFLKKIGGEK